MWQDGRLRRGAHTLAFLVAALAGAALLSACHDASSQAVPGGDPERGKAIMATYGCGACHVIPGVTNAHGMVGPPLTFWSKRSFIAGQVPNTPEYLIKWLQSPQAIEPGTAMPDLGVTEGQARDIAAYLYTIE